MTSSIFSMSDNVKGNVSPDLYTVPRSVTLNSTLDVVGKLFRTKRTILTKYGKV